MIGFLNSHKIAHLPNYDRWLDITHSLHAAHLRDYTRFSYQMIPLQSCGYAIKRLCVGEALLHQILFKLRRRSHVLLRPRNQYEPSHSFGNPCSGSRDFAAC